MSESISLDEFWGENSYKHPPLTEEMIAFAERELGVKLPAEYIAMLRIQNGGYTRGFGHAMKPRSEWDSGCATLNALAGINRDVKNRRQNVMCTAYMTAEWGLPPRQVLLAGDGHWWISLDYRSGDTPSVVLITTEGLDEPNVREIAPTFAEFFAGLRPMEEFD